MGDIPLGPVQGMPAREYHKIKALSNSGMKKLEISPAHFEAPEEEVSPQKQITFDIGSAFHTATLEPEKYEKRVIVTDAARVATKDRKAAAEKNQVILKRPEHDMVQAMARAVRNHPDAGPLVDGGVTELSCFWKDPVFGFLCKLRVDKVTDNIVVVDLKSTTDAKDKSRGHGSFYKNFFSLRYHWQAYWYLKGLSIATDTPHDNFAFVAVEKDILSPVDDPDPKCGINVFYAHKKVLAFAMEEIEPLLSLYAECLEKDQWPCYEPGAKWIELPEWARRKMEVYYD